MVAATSLPVQPGARSKDAQRFHYWDYLNKNMAAQAHYFFDRKKTVCVGVGACQTSDFSVKMIPTYRQQEFWLVWFILRVHKCPLLARTNFHQCY